MKWISAMVSLWLLAGFTQAQWNNPYPNESSRTNVLYSSFSERPKTLDPAKSYSSNEYLFLAQIYEPPLQYHYLLRPLTLIPGTVTEVPQAEYYDIHDKRLADTAQDKDIAYSIYNISIKPGILYAPHPAFAKQKNGEYLYHHLSENYVYENGIDTLADFPQRGTRELVAADYVYQIKRLADPRTQSPILGLMADYIVGLKEYATELHKFVDKPYIDLRKYDLSGVKIVDQYHYQIKIKGKYPQFLYWLTMPFFAPMPWEADLFYSQPNFNDRNITIEWYPIGTGPYLLTENNPNRRMVLDKNPNFHGEKYPSTGLPGDKEKGLLQHAGQSLPFVDKVIFSLELESIPRWTKFLQGYYDTSGVSSDSFEQAIHIDDAGKPLLSEEMQDRNIRMQISVDPSIYYMGFNMLDDTVGGFSERARKLRQAISIAYDEDEFISIFLNGRGLPAQGPIPPGIFGNQDTTIDYNSTVYELKNGKLISKPLEVAKQLLSEAGYPNGIDPKTKHPLLLNYDVPASTAPDDKARFDWMRKQFEKIGIQLNIRATQYNNFQEKMRVGQAQIFSWGWHADYPDPENFLFLLYGPNGKVKFGGENASNYSNPEFDKLFLLMKNMPNNPERLKVISQMVDIVRKDTPWLFGFYPQDFSLQQEWVGITKPSLIANNTLKYISLNPELRAKDRLAWNKPVIWPLGLIFSVFIASLVPVVVRYRKQEYQRK